MRIEAGDLAGAKATISKITDKGVQIYSYLNIASAMAKANDIAGARKSVEQAKLILSSITEPTLLDEHTQNISQWQASIGDVADAVAWAHSQKEPKLQIAALIGAANGMAAGK